MKILPTIPVQTPAGCSARAGSAVRALLLILLASTTVWASGRKLELLGQTEPPVRAVVGIYSIEQPFVAHGTSNAHGRFRFSDITPGMYIVQVQIRNASVVSRSVDITPSFADERGQVHFTIPVQPSERESVQPRYASYFVSIDQLQIPGKARKEFTKALNSLRGGNATAARKHLKRTVDLAPSYASAWNYLGSLATDEGHFDKAEWYFREALRQDSEALESLTNLGATLLKLGKCQEALEYNLRMEHKRPSWALVNSHLGRNYLCLGENQKAIHYLVEAKRIDPSLAEFPQLYLAKIYISQGDLEAAQRELQEFLERHPDLPEFTKVREWAERVKHAQR